MAALAQITYDPAVAVSKATSSLLAMTAFDTTNLRATFTVPTNGIVMVRIRAGHTGTTTFPRILLGVLEGATVRFRMSPMGQYSGTAVANSIIAAEAIGLVTGLTPGASLTWDAAYGVEIVQASNNIKYGGPNDAVGADAFGGLVFEVWETFNLLAGKLYDPSSAASIVTTAARAMGAMDTTNLRLTFNAPPSGKVHWRIRAFQHGNTSYPQVLLGVMEGASVLARVAPIMGTPMLATAGCLCFEASGVISGLTPGSSHTYDAASAVQVGAGAGGAIKHGGPNNTTSDDAFGGTAFELWAA